VASESNAGSNPAPFTKNKIVKTKSPNMKRPFLDAYRKFAAAGELPESGIYCSLPTEATRSETWRIIEPDNKESNALGRKDLSICYWDSGLPWNDSNKYRAFTPLRANILLLCACVNGEY
jgi:hypothetical protein